MEVKGLCAWLGTLPLSQEIAESPWMFPTIESVHVIAIALVVGSIAVVDLRLLGFKSAHFKVTERVNHLLPFTWVAFAVALISGGLMFLSQAKTYCGNIHFRLKLVALALAGVNMIAFHVLGYRDVARWDSSAKTPPAAKFAGSVSLTLWVSIVCLGRWIGFD